MIEHDASDKNAYFSKERYATAYKALSNLNNSPIEHTKNILGGKCGFMCQYAKEINFVF